MSINANRICDKHISNPVKIYVDCIGCEIENINADAKKLIDHWKGEALSQEDLFLEKEDQVYRLSNQIEILKTENTRVRAKLEISEQRRNELVKVESGNIQLWKENETLRQTLYTLVRDVLVFYDDEEINDKQFREVVELIARNAVSGKE